VCVRVCVCVCVCLSVRVVHSNGAQKDPTAFSCEHALIIEAAGTSKKSVNFYQITR
jgi:hypothetical protein